MGGVCCAVQKVSSLVQAARARLRPPKTTARSREAGKRLAAVVKMLSLDTVTSEDWKEVLGWVGSGGGGSQCGFQEAASKAGAVRALSASAPKKRLNTDLLNHFTGPGPKPNPHRGPDLLAVHQSKSIITSGSRPASWCKQHTLTVPAL